MLAALSTVRQLLRLDCPHPGGRHSLACHLWGPESAPAVLCVHGLTRNARDFDPLVTRLAGRFRIVAVDLPGRGASEPLTDPALYGDDTYLADLRRAIDAFAPGPLRWVGTSLGGRLGMKMAAAEPGRVAGLVLNDIGAEVDGADLARLRGDAEAAASFTDLAEAEAWMRRRYAAFGPLTDARWREFAAHSVAHGADGRLSPCFDARAVPKAPPAGRVDYWDLYRAIRCPVLVLRGAESKLLSRAACEAMAAAGEAGHGPRTRWLEVPGAGHAPDLGLPGLAEAVADFLEGTL